MSEISIEQLSAIDNVENNIMYLDGVPECAINDYFKDYERMRTAPNPKHTGAIFKHWQDYEPENGDEPNLLLIKEIIDELDDEIDKVRAYYLFKDAFRRDPMLLPEKFLKRYNTGHYNGVDEEITDEIAMRL